jgi:hypothetical protein
MPTRQFACSVPCKHLRMLAESHAQHMILVSSYPAASQCLTTNQKTRCPTHYVFCAHAHKAVCLQRALQAHEDAGRVTCTIHQRRFTHYVNCAHA